MEGEPEAVFWSSVIASARYRNKPQSSYLWQQCWTDPILFCGVFKVWFDLIFNGATISRTPHGSVQGCNVAVSTVSHDLKHISLHLILQNQSFFFLFVYESLLPKLEKLSENLCLQELPRIKKSLEGGEARFILAFLKCSKSESTRMVKGDLLILSCSQLVTWAHLDNILKVTSSWNKRSFKSCDSYFPKRHAEGNRANPVSGETLWMSKKWIQ